MIMNEVPAPDENLFLKLMKCIQAIDSPTFSKRELKLKFKQYIRADDELYSFIMGTFNGNPNRYANTINSILEILENINFIGKSPSDNTRYQKSGDQEIRSRIITDLGYDENIWGYVLCAKSSPFTSTPSNYIGQPGMISENNYILENKNKKEIFNIGKGLFWDSLSYLCSPEQCSKFLIWLSNSAYTIIQSHSKWIISIHEDHFGTISESLEWLLEPSTKSELFGDDFSLLYQAKLKRFESTESLLYFWEILSKLGWNSTHIPREGIMLLNSPSNTFTGIEYDLEPRGQLFDGTCLATSFELICDHLTRPLPAMRNQDARSHSIHPTHNIDTGSPFSSIHLDGTKLNWNQGMLHSAILGQTARMWLLAESFGFTVALHSPDEQIVANARAKLPWYSHHVERLDFSRRHVQLSDDIDSWKQRLLEILLRGNLPLICINSDDFSKKLQNGTYVWADGDTAAKRDMEAKTLRPDLRRGRCEGNMEKEDIGHAMTISGVHLRKPKEGDPVLLWKVLDSNPGHGFLKEVSTDSRYLFDPQYLNQKSPNGGGVIWLTTNELFNQLDSTRVWIHEIAWTKDEPVRKSEDHCHTAKFLPLSNFVNNR